MSGVEVLRMQLLGSFNLIREAVQSVPVEDWNRSASPGSSRIGFVLWHCARIIDWAVHTALRGVPELADDPSWRARLAPEALFGAGIPASVADAVPDQVSQSTLLEYLDALQPAVLGWLEAQSPDALDFPVDLRRHQAERPEYMREAVWSEIASLDGIPAWQLLARPSISHVRVHMGEVGLLRQLLVTAPTS
jgi:hypothetical protein